MKMRKLLLTCAAIASVSLAFSISAFAADPTVTMNGDTASVPSLPATEGQMTVMVIDMDDSATVPTPSADNILYIDQVAYGANIFQDMKLKEAVAEESYYAIRVGGEKASGVEETIYKVGKLVAGNKTADGYNTFSAMAPIKATPGTTTFKITNDKVADKEVIGELPTNIELTAEIIPIIKYKAEDVEVGSIFTVELLEDGTSVDSWNYEVPSAE